tara:strand:+ start:49 stop:738 length:690 start_codon:yes stop_codon:yes gene_type:complete
MSRLTFISLILTFFMPLNFANAQAGIAYYVDVENPTAFVQALETLNNSPDAQSDNITVALSMSVANGQSSATHVVNVIGDSLSDIDALRRTQATSQAFSDFITVNSGNVTNAAELMFNSMGVQNGKESLINSPNPYTWYIHLLVSDIPAYLEALEELMDANNDRDVYMHAYQVMGTGSGGANLTVVNRANSLEDLLSTTNEYDEFIEKTIDIRTPVSNGIYQTLGVWSQ